VMWLTVVVKNLIKWSLVGHLYIVSRYRSLRGLERMALPLLLVGPLMAEFKSLPSHICNASLASLDLPSLGVDHRCVSPSSRWSSLETWSILKVAPQTLSSDTPLHIGLQTIYTIVLASRKKTQGSSTPMSNWLDHVVRSKVTSSS
jgi:hypothetical protein